MRYGFYKSISLEFDTLFTGGFGDAVEIELTRIVKNLGIEVGKLNDATLTNIEVAIIKEKINDLEREISNEIDKEGHVHDKVIRMWRDFEELCFNLSRADGHLTIEQLEQKSVYDFYRYKELLTDEIKRKNKSGESV